MVSMGKRSKEPGEAIYKGFVEHAARRRGKRNVGKGKTEADGFSFLC